MTSVRALLGLALLLAAGAGCAAAGQDGRASATSPQEAPLADDVGLARPVGGAIQPADPPPRKPPLRPADLPRKPKQPSLPGDLSALHGPCPGQGCPEGMQCVKYCGIAGCRPGSVFRSCEIPCKGDAQCPAGLSCGQVADGPGRVCLGGEESPRPVPPDAEVE